MRDFSSAGSWVIVAGLVALAAGLGFAAPQFNAAVAPVQSVPIDELDHSHMPDDQPYVSRELQARQLKRLREEHQKEVFSDTNRLVELATALKQQMLKGVKDPGDALKDVDEIGKLAKRVSDRIKTQ